MKYTPSPVSGNGQRKQTLHQAVGVFANLLRTWAETLSRNDHSPNSHRQWKARGSQKTLRWVARELLALSRTHADAFTLSIALAEFLHCLQKSLADADLEAHSPYRGRGLSVQQWKAEGESGVLSPLCQRLSRLVEQYTPTTRRAVLSADGKSLVPLADLGADTWRSL